LKIEERVLARRWCIRVAPGEVACIMRLGKARKQKDPGMRFAVPGLDKVHLLNSQPHSVQVHINPVSSDGIRVSMDVTVHYRLMDGKRYLTDRPTGDRPEQVYETLLEARASELVARYQPYGRLLSERSALARDLTDSFAPHANMWGLQVDDITVNWVGLPDALPQSATDREAARIEIDTKRARGIGDGEQYREAGMARLDVRERELAMFRAFAEDMRKHGLSSSDLRDVMHLLLRETEPATDLIAKKMEKKMEAEGISEGALAAAEKIRSDPKYTFMLEELRNSNSRPIIDLRSPEFRGKPLEELDRLLSKELWDDGNGTAFP
jgi:regulator of protease activity HflC (stomatin/prohibitin superfamily)